MTTYAECHLNGQFPLMVPDFRKAFWDARPNWERGRMESCHELMQPGMTVYDIGAEHGDMTAAYRSWVGSTGTVIPIEPSAHYWEYIRGTWDANGFQPEPAMMFVGLVGQHPRGSRPFEAKWPNESIGGGVPDGGFLHLHHDTKSPITSIDEMAVLTPPHAIVLDIEGAELLALRGAANTLQTHRPLVWVSVHDIGDGAGWNGPLKDWYNAVPQDIHDYMNETGYDAEELPYMGEGEHFWLYTPR